VAEPVAGLEPVDEGAGSAADRHGPRLASGYPALISNLRLVLIDGGPHADQVHSVRLKFLT
jgi:hypothetical protein